MDKKVQNIFNFAVRLKESGEYNKAIEYYNLALQQNPDFYEARINLTNLYTFLNKNKKAKKEFDILLKYFPSSVDVLNNYATFLKEQHKLKKAIKYYKKAKSQDKSFFRTYYNISLVYFLQGKYTKGWKNYEYRLQEPYFKQHFSEFINIWQGQSLANKTLLIVSEQGFGDNIQFIRYAIYLKKKHPSMNIIVITTKPLVRLFSSIKEIYSVSSFDEQIPYYDYFIPIMSLGKQLNIKAKNIFAKKGYLKNINTDKYDFLNDITKFKIGFVFSGSKANMGDKEIDLKYFKSLFSLKHKIEFYSLQVGNEANKIKQYRFITDLGIDFIDFYDTANAIKKMDLIISIDTAVAHLAGAMRKPCFVLVSNKTGYFWGLKSSKTNWYKSITLFREDKTWNRPIKNIIKYLNNKKLIKFKHNL